MARFIRDLLDAEEPIFTQSIRQLEEASGRTGADAQLIGDITKSAHDSMRALGLSPASVTGEEVYRALLDRVELDAKRLTRIIGGNDPDDVRHLVPYIIEAANLVKFNRRVFALKYEKAKDLLRKMPPKQLMRHLGYSDLEAMFEAEDIAELYVSLRFSEGPAWLDQFNELFNDVKASDFEERDIKIIQLDQAKYADIAAGFVQKKLHNVSHAKEIGVLAVVPMKARKMRGLALKTLPLLLHYMNEIKMYSTFFKVKSTKPSFGRTVAETLIADPDTSSQVAGQRVHWRVIQRYLGHHKEDEIGTAAFEPHIQPGDLYWRDAEELLYQIDPELEFWRGRGYVGLNYNNFPVSFNLFDVSFAYSNKEPYSGRYAYHFRESLWNEIFIRYMGLKNLSKQIVEQLDSDKINPDKVIAHTSTGRKVATRRTSSGRKIKDNKNLLLRRRMIDAAEGRLETVVEEFEHVFDILSQHEKTVTIFGSARKQNDEVTHGAYDLAARLSREGYAVVTGGGHGVMEAANRGAYEAGGESIGLNIQLPFEQTLNDYTTANFEFKHFFGRKVSMTLDASAFIYFPGGFGTFDELFEILALQQTHKIDRTPIVLVGSDFWRPWDAAIREVMLDKYNVISYEDTELYRIYDSYDDIIEYINSEYKKNR